MAIGGNSDGKAGGLSFHTRLVCVAFLLYFAAAALSANIGRFSDLTAWLLFAQDRWLLLAEALVLAAATIALRPGGRPLTLSPRLCHLLALSLIPLCYLGHIWPLCGYDMSRDEQMAVFDARIFAHGLLAQPLPAAWQTHTDALNSLFLLPAAHPIAWVSAYLPVNAALRALVGLAVDPNWTSPILTAIGAIALWNCARRLWPDNAEAPTVALLLYLTSGQVLFAGMTAYAMAAHLTFNLLWLWLFLIGRRWSDCAALIVGALATGLHQPLFHPMFAGPFILVLLGRRAWGRAACFILGYAVICGFWLSWPHLIYARIEGAHPSAVPLDADFWARLRAVLDDEPEARWTDMAANLLRFIGWQPILLLPLFIAGFATGIAVARRDAMPIALAGATLLPLIVATILMPDQGQGFGYRYLHGVIGSAILVALYGWNHLVELEARWRPLLGRTLVGGALALLPMQALMTYAYQQSAAMVEARVASSGADYIIIGNDDAPESGGLVINRADLSNRPLRLFADKVDPDLTHLMCARRATVALPTGGFYAPINRYFSGTLISLAADRRIWGLGRQLRQAGCDVRVIGGA